MPSGNGVAGATWVLSLTLTTAGCAPLILRQVPVPGGGDGALVCGVKATVGENMQSAAEHFG